MQVVIAPDKFKGSLSADGVADALAAGLAAALPSAVVDLVPMADGGDGTVDAALRAGYVRSQHTVTGPTGSPVRAAIAVQGQTAVVELAAASGLVLLEPGALAPMTASSRGTGELLAAALDLGCTRIVLGLGGSACTDGGAGLVAALGGRLLDATGATLPDGGGALADLARIDLSSLDARLSQTDFVVALDVDNPLLGDTGAAHTFGPQKGADHDQVEQLDAGLARFADALADVAGPQVHDTADVPGAGAAGGVGFAALSVLQATPRPGLDLVADLVDLAGRVQGADLVVTGEGSLDRQSLSGKTPVGVARIARAAGVPAVVAACGVSTLSGQEAADGGLDAVWTLAEIEPDARASMANAAQLLTAVGKQIGRWAADEAHSTRAQSTTRSKESR
ncbi:glycerate kinase [Flexivirga sp. B27]